MQTRHLTRYWIVVATAVLGMIAPAHAATEAQAEEILSEFQRSQQLWVSEMKLATTDEQRALINQKKPEPAPYAKRLRLMLARDLDKAWTLRYGAWLLENDPTLKPNHQRALLNAVQNHHMLSPELGRFCIAMVRVDNSNEQPVNGVQPKSLRSRAMKMLETIKVKNPHPKVQGQAALALSLIYASLGEDARVMKGRLQNLREAIIKSADVKIGNTTVADIARTEIYIINNLSKGRPAPDFQGNDSGGLPLKLSDYRGKVVMLVFWSSFDTDLPRMREALEMLRKIQNSKANQPFVMLGVNRDTKVNLRLLEADNIVTWRNFSDPQQVIAKAYHIPSWPFCMVLDEKGIIRYRGAIGSFADAVANDLLAKGVTK